MKKTFINFFLIIFIWSLSFIPETNSFFKANGSVKESNVSTEYWVKPEIEIKDDENDYAYDSENQIEIKWRGESYGNEDKLKFTILVSGNLGKDYKTVQKDLKEVFSYELEFGKVKELLEWGDAEEYNFIIKIEAVDEHNLKSDDRSKEYTYLKAEDTKETGDDDKDDDENKEDEEKEKNRSPDIVEVITDNNSTPSTEEVPVETANTPAIVPTESAAEISEIDVIVEEAATENPNPENNEETPTASSDNTNEEELPDVSANTPQTE